MFCAHLIRFSATCSTEREFSAQSSHKYCSSPEIGLRVIFCDYARLRYDSTQSLHRNITLQPVGGELSHAPFLLLITYDTPKHGQCPECGENISAAHVLVEYE